ncbi:MAG: cytochrome c maturation protein CcmE [Chloroflexota bacterium]
MVETSGTWKAAAVRRPARRKSMTKFLIGGIVFAVAVAYLIFSAIQASSVFYLTIKELHDGAAGTGPARVAGKVVDGTIKYDARTMVANFAIGDGPERLDVVYKGVLPDAFKPDADVIVEGHYVAGQPFQAKELLTKCPSKYESAVAEPQSK